MKIKSARKISGVVTPSGDKSISHRAAIIAALASGTSRLSNFSHSVDCASTLASLQKLGVSIAHAGNGLRITGTGMGRLAEPRDALDCGNSGTTMRLLAGVLAGQRFVSQLTGDESLKSRPMRRIIEPLELMGTQVESVAGKPPLRIRPTLKLNPIHYELPVASAQVKSCVLFAGLHAEGRTSVVEREGTRDHTERLLRWYNASIEVRGAEISVAGGISFPGRDVDIPGDISSAAFFIAAAALLPGSTLTVKAVSLNPSRIQFLSELRSLGADITIAEVHEISNEPVGNVHVKGGLTSSGPKRLAGELIPQLIDELPLMAILGTQVSGGIEIRNALELRVKESDRLATTVRNLRAMGAEVEEYPDGLSVSGPTRLQGAVLDSHGDHRIAMAFAVAALVAQGETELLRAECVAVSFPAFFELLESLAVRTP